MNFLVLELQDIKNNKGNVTLQVRSIEHLQTWLKRDSRLSNETLIRPFEASLSQVKESLGQDGAWWKSKADGQTKEPNEDEWTKPTDYKSGSKAATGIEQIAKQHHMSTDVKRAVF